MRTDSLTNLARGVACTSLALTAILARPAFADELQPFEASYEWMWHGMTVAVSSLKLEHQGDHWVYRSRSTPRGIGKIFSERPTLESVLRVTAAGTEPLSYKADDGTSSTKRDAQLQYDWEQGRVTGVYEDVKVNMPLQPGIQDDLSIQIALMVELLRGHAPDKFQLIDKNTVREYRYTREGEDTIATPFGPVQTVVYQARKAGSPRITRFWCAPARGYVPMKIEQKRDDDVQWTMQIQSLDRP